MASKPLPSLITTFSEMEVSLAELAQQQEAVGTALRDTAKPVVSKRLDDLEAALKAEGATDVGRSNVLLRQLVNHAVIMFDRSACRRRPSALTRSEDSRRA